MQALRLATEQGPTLASPAAPGPYRDLVYQTLAVMALVLGGWYVAWRWTMSLNPDALAFAVVIAAAETLGYVGDVVFALSIWRVHPEVEAQRPPRTVQEIAPARAGPDRPLKIDVLITTYGEAVDLVRLSVRDAKQLRYPHPVAIRVHVLDDGRRPAMRAMAAQEGVSYITRASNVGFKAGNLRNGLAHTDGDLFVICDADTRPLPALLEETLGYFRDPQVAWVQTPQWFYDVPQGTPLPQWLGRTLRLGPVGRLAGRTVEALIGPVRVGADPLGNDPRAFYDVIQRSRNWCNASFCCGAGSIHRREAVMEGALKHFVTEVRAATERVVDDVEDPVLRPALAAAVAGQAARRIEITPYRFHVSEDIYTSIGLHSDPERRWRSVYHPRVLTRMLSPQDLLSWTIQRFKYASGTLDIACHDNPLRRRGLTGWQKLMYGATAYSYLAPLWLVPLLLAPLVFFVTGATPVAAYDIDFFARLLPFLVAKRLAFMVGTWGVSTYRAEQYHLASFWLHLRALAHVIARKPLRFQVTPKHRQARRSVGLVVPHLVLVVATLAGMGWRAALIFTGAAPPELVAFVTNVFWSLYNVACLLPMILVAVAPRPLSEERVA